MNYKILITAVLANFLLVLNSWAGCCFMKPTINLPPPTYQCIDAPDVFTCDGQFPSAAYVDNNAICLGDGFTCCIIGETAIEFLYEGIIVEVEHPECIPGPPIVLPVDITEFTATLGEDSSVYLEGKGNAYGEKAQVEIWRAQIRNDGHNGRIVDPTMIGKTKVPEGTGMFSFSATDTSPLNGVNYYVPAERMMDGEYTAYCDYIQSVVIGEGIPNLALAKRLCEQHKILPLLQIFAP
jgi:hypothetical protein